MGPDAPEGPVGPVGCGLGGVGAGAGSCGTGGEGVAGGALEAAGLLDCRFDPPPGSVATARIRTRATKTSIASATCVVREVANGPHGLCE